ncbi:MAG: 2-amino-4-hydroxy-6-hydroxymethyldihydropteridine diphosphokinase [Mycobacteriaceae bacterium]
MTRVVLSAGSNMGDRVAHLQAVVNGLEDSLIALSSVYSTAPWGGVAQDDFYNIVAIAERAKMNERDWLSWCQELERQQQRVREQRWGPRSLDVDIIVYGDLQSTDLDLQLPHPRAHQRAFVLIPWLEIEPEAQLWTDSKMRTVSSLISELSVQDREGVLRTDITLAGQQR